LEVREMKGVINKGVQELIETRFGSDVWERVKARAGCHELTFSPALDYPDEMTAALVGAAAEQLELTPEDVMVEFGKFVVSHTVKNTYPGLFAMAGRSAREFLKNMDRIHAEVTSTIPNARPPSLVTEDLDDGRLVMHYRSARGLCPVLRGLIQGVGTHFGQEVTVEEEACMHEGSEGCRMVITFPEGQ
jgi:predicted hydrocarbon binding protein